MTVVRDIKHGQITTQGLEQLSSMYHEMWGLTGNKSIKKAVTRSLRKGTTIIRKAYKDAAPDGPVKKPTKKHPNLNHNKMKKSSRQKVRRPQKRKNSFAKVGFNVGIKGAEDSRRSHHAHFVITGTKQRVRKDGIRTGRVRPSAILAIKVSQRYPAAIRAIEDEFIKYINSL